MFPRVYLWVLTCILICSALHAEENNQENGNLKDSFDCYDGNSRGGVLTLLRFRQFGHESPSVLRVRLSGGGMRKVKSRSNWKGDSYILSAETAKISEEMYEECKAICLSAVNEVKFSQNLSDARSLTSSMIVVGFNFFETDIQFESIYCGGLDNAKEAFYKPLQEARDKINEIVKGLDWVEDVDDGIADFVNEVMMSQMIRYRHDQSQWWLMGQIIRMTGIKGNYSAVPLLIELIQIEQTDRLPETAPIKERNLGIIVTALDEITGKARRFDTKGKPKSTGAVVDEYLRLYGLPYSEDN